MKLRSDGKNYTDLYNVLGVSRNADPREISDAYNSIVDKFNREKEKAEAQIEQANKAYGVLNNENMRMRYNNTLDSQPVGNGRTDPASGEGAREENGEFMTVFTIDGRGNFFMEKIEKSGLPPMKEKAAYTLFFGGGKRTFIPKDLWNSWRELCELLRSRDAIKTSIEDVGLAVELLTEKNGRLMYSKTVRTVSQLPLTFPENMGRLGEIYAYCDEKDNFKVLDRYTWRNLRRDKEELALDQDDFDGGENTAL